MNTDINHSHHITPSLNWLLSLVIFVVVALTVLAIEATTGLIGTDRYYLAHGLFGLGFPFLWHAITHTGQSGEPLHEDVLRPQWRYLYPRLAAGLDRTMAIIGDFRTALLVTATWHFGNELWEDQLTRETFMVDMDQLAAGVIGMVLAWMLYRTIRKHLPSF